MGKTSKWIKNFLTGKKNSSYQQTRVDTHEIPQTPISVSLTTLKDKRRWSFRKPSNTEICYKETSTLSTTATTTPDMKRAVEGENELKKHAIAVETEHEKMKHVTTIEIENEQKKHAMAVAMSNVVAADAAIAAAQAAEVMIRVTYSKPERGGSVQETSATKIQSVFRSYLARKALYALKGLVKLQALVRGHMVRKQAIATLRCMQALLTVQARARARRISMIDEPNPYNQKLIYTKSTTHERLTHPVHDYQMEESIKIVEMDVGDKHRSAKSKTATSSMKQTDYRLSNYHHHYSKQNPQHISPVPSAITNMSPRTYSGYFNDHSVSTRHSSPKCHSPISRSDRSNLPFETMCYEYQLFPNYMANTKSSKAKFRSQSAPKQRPESMFQRQQSKRRTTIEGRNVPKAIQMQRSSSLVNATRNSQYPWSALDKSVVSVKDSECGSNSTILANSYYCRF